jgi:hypothetical protein
MVKKKSKFIDHKMKALKRLRGDRYFNSRLMDLSKTRYYQAIKKFFVKSKKMPDDVKEEDIEIYLD